MLQKKNTKKPKTQKTKTHGTGKSPVSTHWSLLRPWQGYVYMPGQIENIILRRWNRSLKLLQRTGGSCGAIRHLKKTWRTGIGVYGLGKCWVNNVEREWVSHLIISLFYWLRGFGRDGQRGRVWKKPWSFMSLVAFCCFYRGVCYSNGWHL